MSSYDVSGVNYGSATAAKTYAKTGADNTSLAGRESTESSTDMDFNDFLQLMVVQMTNQDFMNPTDNTEYMSQMAQFASMQAMNELASYSKTNYAMGLVGKEVTASRYTQTGELDTTTGTVTRVSLVGNEYKLYVDGKEYELEEIMQINEPVEDGYARWIPRSCTFPIPILPKKAAPSPGPCPPKTPRCTAIWFIRRIIRPIRISIPWKRWKKTVRHLAAALPTRPSTKTLLPS